MALAAAITVRLESPTEDRPAHLLLLQRTLSPVTVQFRTWIVSCYSAVCTHRNENAPSGTATRLCSVAFGNGLGLLRVTRAQ